MNATTLSGSVRAASVRRPARPVIVQAAESRGASRVTDQGEGTGAASPAACPIRTAEIGGVLHVLGRDGASLGPVSSPAMAQSYGHALRRLGLA